MMTCRICKRPLSGGDVQLAAEYANRPFACMNCLTPESGAWRILMFREYYQPAPLPSAQVSDAEI